MHTKKCSMKFYHSRQVRLWSINTQFSWWELYLVKSLLRCSRSMRQVYTRKLISKGAAMNVSCVSLLYTTITQNLQRIVSAHTSTIRTTVVHRSMWEHIHLLSAVITCFTLSMVNLWWWVCLTILWIVWVVCICFMIQSGNFCLQGHCQPCVKSSMFVSK